MPAQRRSFFDMLEPLIYLETSFVFIQPPYPPFLRGAYFDDMETYHGECLAFEQRLRNEEVLPVSSDFTHNELSFILIRNILAAEGKRTGQHWQEVKRANPALLIKSMPTILACRDELNRLTLRLTIGDGVNSRAYDLMTRYPLLPTDAYHIATALESGVSAIATRR
jgi:predicted nucleic acid-binding protein